MAVARRAVLSGAAALALPLTGCAAGTRRVMPPASPDVGLLATAIAGESALVDLYTATLTARPDLAVRLNPVLAHHRDHLTALRAHYRQGSVTVSPVPVPAATPAASVAVLKAAEGRAAAARTADAAAAPPALAQLMAAIGACEAAHSAYLALHT